MNFTLFPAAGQLLAVRDAQTTPQQAAQTTPQQAAHGAAPFTDAAAASALRPLCHEMADILASMDSCRTQSTAGSSAGGSGRHSTGGVEHASGTAAAAASLSPSSLLGPSLLGLQSVATADQQAAVCAAKQRRLDDHVNVDLAIFLTHLAANSRVLDPTSNTLIPVGKVCNWDDPLRTC